MKLSEHVVHLRILIEKAFDKEFSRLGIGATKQIELEKLPAELHAKRQRFEEMLQSHVGETGSYGNAREKLLDELTFTLFNRIAAIKVMEAASLFPPIMTKQPEHGDRSFGHRAWLELRSDMRGEELEGIREYIIHAFNELGETLPLYHRDYPYALLPDAIGLNEIIDAFNKVEVDPQVETDIWKSDDVLGWLYESYNNTKKAEFKESKAKTEYDKVSLQSQVYTPRWVVQFLVENSLGKLYLEMYPNSEIKTRYKIANAPKTQERELKPLHEVKLIDPASGSGNFLLYAFDFFYELYLDQIENYGADYEENEIPQLIIENNLHGIDLDDRAVQLAQLGLYIKARKKRRSIGSLKFNVVSSDFFLPDYEAVRHIFEDDTKLDQSQRDMIADIWGDLQYAYKFGSLIRLDEKLKSRMMALEAKQGASQQEIFIAAEIAEQRDFATIFFSNLRTAVEQYSHSEANTFLVSKTHDAITFLELLTREYDIATANPPYTDSAAFGPELKRFVEANFRNPHKFHTNLYAAFIKKCDSFLSNGGKIAMVHPLTFMYIKTFEGVRKYILDNYHINVLVEAGMGGVFPQHIFVDPVFYVLEKQKVTSLSLFVSLNQYSNTNKQRFKKDYLQNALTDFIDGIENEHNYTIEQSKLAKIKSSPFIYWISNEFREKFGREDLQTIFSPAQGAATTNNLKFLRFWWEVHQTNVSKNLNVDKKRWILYAKGGPFNKWAGNLWLVVDYFGKGKNLRDDGAVLRNSDLYLTEGVTYSASGAKGPSFRYLPENCIFDTGGSCIFANKEFKNNSYLLGFMNSKLISYMIKCLNPTVNAQVGDMQRVPFVVPSHENEVFVSTLSQINVNIKRLISRNSITEIDAKMEVVAIEPRYIREYLCLENHLITQILINESLINDKIFEVYELTQKDKTLVLSKEGDSVGSLPVDKEACDAYLSEINTNDKFPLDNIKEYIKSLPIKNFNVEERESIQNRIPSLYQSNNDLEQFCIRYHINPINVWYWFKQSKVIPIQRMNTLAMEFLVEMIREILMEDDDGVIPLIPNAGEKALIDRIEDKFRKKGFSLAQYSSFDSVLGASLDIYLNKSMFEDLSEHLNMFRELPKTPFIWHLSSGPEQGFDCYIIIYKWSRDKLMRLRSVYIEHRERSLVNRQSDLADNNSAEAQNEKDQIFKQLREIESFKTKIDELLAEGYDPILDDGVGKNIAPLQKKKMIPYDVLNAGQLNKYLNADW